MAASVEEALSLKAQAELISEVLSNVIVRYEDQAAEFDDFNKRQRAIHSATA
ncbi:MAG: hypothetical protein ACTIL9_11650 [Marinomonas sp.]